MQDIKDPKNLMHYLMVTHAPLINKTIKSLRAAGHLPDVQEGGLEDDDLHIPGLHGLMDAVKTYNPNLGSFKTHASNRIRGKILDHAKSFDEIPQHVRAEAKAFNRAMKEGMIPKPEED